MSDLVLYALGLLAGVCLVIVVERLLALLGRMRRPRTPVERAKAASRAAARESARLKRPSRRGTGSGDDWGGTITPGVGAGITS